MANDFFYKKVNAYNLSKEYVVFIYNLLRNYPPFEQYALCDQMRRSAISIPSNIAEGLGRTSIKERIHFIEIAFASLTELSCQLDISHAIGNISQEELSQAEDMSQRLSKVMSGLKNYLTNKLNN